MNESTALARTVVLRLLAAGVRDVVLAPGSRSAPLALALAEAERRHRIRLHVRVDERSAGFLALGLAKISRRPVPVVCTSGSAVANLAPAVVEAAYAGVALVAITADRPPELRGVGSNQTIDQVGFFGQQVRTAVDVVTYPDERDPEKSVILTVDRVLADAQGVAGGGPAPVHLNLAFREPLVPDSAWDAIQLEPNPGTIGARAVSSPANGEIAEMKAARSSEDAESSRKPHLLLREPINYIAGDLGLAHVPTRGVVLVGDVPVRQISEQAIELADACGWPLISEPSGNGAGGVTFIPGASLGLADPTFLKNNQPELVVTIGRFGLSRPVMSLVRSAEHHVVVHVGGKDRPDPLRTGAVVLSGVPRIPTTDSLVSWTGRESGWLQAWQQLALRVRERIDLALQAPPVTGLDVAIEVWNAAKSADLILAAASRTARYFEAVTDSRADPPWVIGNRGTSGIDGLISTAYGAGLARLHAQDGPGGSSSPDARIFAVVGDLAFLHDHNGLLAPTEERRPNLTLVVVDNNGGGIFSSLEQGSDDYQGDFERVFGTPPGQDLVAIAAATGWQTHSVTTNAELRAALAASATGTQVIVVRAADRIVEQRQWAEVLGTDEEGKDLPR